LLFWLLVFFQLPTATIDDHDSDQRVDDGFDDSLPVKQCVVAMMDSRLLGSNEQLVAPELIVWWQIE
jgi:hypothetical protein